MEKKKVLFSKSPSPWGAPIHNVGITLSRLPNGELELIIWDGIYRETHRITP